MFRRLWQSLIPTKAPLLKQYSDLRPADFEEHPVWVSVHTMDYDEPWYDETDEETFRPWTGALPVDPAGGMFLVAAKFALADESDYPGFLTPAVGEPSDHQIGDIQPQLFTPRGDRIAFWFGMSPLDQEVLDDVYGALGVPREAVFPISFAAQSGLALGTASGILRGFYSSPNMDTVDVVA
jgi:hypothetical protein